MLRPVFPATDTSLAFVPRVPWICSRDASASQATSSGQALRVAAWDWVLKTEADIKDQYSVWDPSGIWSASLVTVLTAQGEKAPLTPLNGGCLDFPCELYYQQFLKEKDLPRSDNTLEATAFLPDTASFPNGLMEGKLVASLP